MQETTSPRTDQSTRTVRQNVTDELTRLRDDLSRVAHEIRMKSQSASAEVQDTRRVLEQEVERFAAQVDQATEASRKDLRELGETLKMRFQKLRNQIAAI